MKQVAVLLHAFLTLPLDRDKWLASSHTLPLRNAQ